MKKILLLIAALVALFVTYPNREFAALPEFADAECEVYLPVSTPCRGVEIAGMKIVTASADEARRLTREFPENLGMSARFEADADAVEKFIKKYSVTRVSRRRIGEIITLYGYAKAFKGGVNVGGETVNVQLAYSGGRLTVGTPLILGSY